MAPASKLKGFLGLSNELLRKLVRNLHAPAAVCLALTCKHLMTVVTSVCDCNLDSIVRRYRGDVLCYDWDNSLQDYSPIAADIALYKSVGSAREGLEKVAHDTICGLKVCYTLEYIGLMRLLDDPRMYSHAQKGHARCIPLGGSECSMCAIVAAREDAVHLKRMKKADLKRLES